MADGWYVVQYSSLAIRSNKNICIALERATYSSKSFLIGLALTLRHITAEQAAQASHVEVNSQIEKWGEVEDCAYIYILLRRDDLAT